MFKKYEQQVKWCLMLLLLWIFIVFAMAWFGWLYNDYRNNFGQIFYNPHTLPHCIGREAFLKSIDKKINQPNPFGILFITGRKNSGKTTTIRAAVAGRKHVALHKLETDINNFGQRINVESQKSFPSAYVQRLFKSY